MANEILLVAETEYLVLETAVQEVLFIDRDPTELLQSISATNQIINEAILVFEIEQLVVSQENTSELMVVTEGITDLIELYEQGPPGVSGVSEEDAMYSKRIDFISDLELYRGEAAVGGLENASVWRIRKIVLNAQGDVWETWASGNANFDKLWLNRTQLSYS